MSEDQVNRLVIVSNRLPVVVSRVDGALHCKPGSGGLVTALAHVLKNRGGLWIGWPGQVEGEEQELIKLLETEGGHSGFTLSPVLLTKEEVQLYYDGFSNEVIWMLFHDLPSSCNFDPKFWYEFQKVNAKFAKSVKDKYQPNDFIWIHDYQLLLVGQELRKLEVSSKVAFFLHIPFPPLDIFVKLPWRFQVLRALLEYDLVGFQTMRDQRNFMNCLRRLLPDIKVQNKGSMHILKVGDREVRIGSFPISIDFKEFSTKAASQEVSEQAWLSHEKISDQKIIFSIDRLDLTKGIPYRLEAIRHLLQTHPELHRKITFIQVVIPSRLDNPQYKELKKEVDRLVGEINSQFTTTGWVPIQYIFRSLSHEELLAFYRTSEVALITPIKDGMNLVSKEYIASNLEENGVLILSEFAGAATQLQHEALLVNPYDIEGLSLAIYRALTLPEEERKMRMRKMRRNVRRYDVFWWVRSYLNAAISKELQDFPILQDFTPSETNK